MGIYDEIADAAVREHSNVSVDFRDGLLGRICLCLLEQEALNAADELRASGREIRLERVYLGDGFAFKRQGRQCYVTWSSAVRPRAISVVRFDRSYTIDVPEELDEMKILASREIRAIVEVLFAGS